MTLSEQLSEHLRHKRDELTEHFMMTLEKLLN